MNDFFAIFFNPILVMLIFTVIKRAVMSLGRLFCYEPKLEELKKESDTLSEDLIFCSAELKKRNPGNEVHKVLSGLCYKLTTFFKKCSNVFFGAIPWVFEFCVKPLICILLNSNIIERYVAIFGQSNQRISRSSQSINTKSMHSYFLDLAKKNVIRFDSFMRLTELTNNLQTVWLISSDVHLKSQLSRL